MSLYTRTKIAYNNGFDECKKLVLEIIDNYTAFRCKSDSNDFEAVILRPQDMKNAIKILKGSEQK